jgi:hypothetical protein
VSVHQTAVLVAFMADFMKTARHTRAGHLTTHMS